MAEYDRNRKFYELQTLVDAGERWLKELQHQVSRLEEHVVARTEEETAYHARLLEGYRIGARYTSVLLKYHKGRLAKLVEGTDIPEEMPSSILDDGRVAPVFEDDEQ